MTTSDVLSAELAQSATRWELPVFGATFSAGTPHTAKHLDELEGAAYQEGFDRGHSEGYAAGLAAAQQQALRLHALLDHMARPLRDIDGETERALVATTIEIARRLAHLEIDLDPTRVVQVVREAVSVLGSYAGTLQVHLHPDDVQLLTHTLAADHRDWRLVADKTLERGDCRISSDKAQVDARLDTRHAVLAQKLLGE